MRYWLMKSEPDEVSFDDVLAAPGATVLLNAPYGPAAVWNHLPREVQEALLEKRLRLFVIDAYALARELGLGGRINAITQAAFFALADEGIHACDLVHCASSAVKTAQATFYEAEIALVADVLREGARTGEFDVADPPRVARAVLRAYASFKPPWVFASERGEIQQAMAAMRRKRATTAA